MALAGLPIEERKMILDLLSQIRQRMLPPEKLRALRRGRDLSRGSHPRAARTRDRPAVAVHPRRVRRHGRRSPRRRRRLGADWPRSAWAWPPASSPSIWAPTPSWSAATDEQKQKWLGQAGRGRAPSSPTRSPSRRPAATSPTSRPPPRRSRTTRAHVTGYRITGNKQFISNGGYADFLTVLAQTPEGPSFFVVEKDMPGFSAGKPEEKHGIRSSNTAAAVLRRRLRAGREPRGRRPRPGTRSRPTRCSATPA